MQIFYVLTMYTQYSTLEGPVLLATFALLRTILNVLPIPGPFLTPLKGQATTLADLRRKAVLCFSFHIYYSTYLILTSPCVRDTSLDYRQPSDIQISLVDPMR